MESEGKEVDGWEDGAEVDVEDQEEVGDEDGGSDEFAGSAFSSRISSWRSASACSSRVRVRGFSCAGGVGGAAIGGGGVGIVVDGVDAISSLD